MNTPQTKKHLNKFNFNAFHAWKHFFFIFSLSVFYFLPKHVFSQMVGANCYVKGNLLEFAIAGNGGFEGVPTGVSPVPAGYHFRSGNPTFGFVSNPQNNGWATFDGDFFTPGSPENGWGIEIINGATDLVASNNCASPYQITGAITGYQVIGNCRLVTWVGNYISGGYSVNVRLDYILNILDLYYTTVVTLTNNGPTIADFYYYRNFDPDNNQSFGGEFPTNNSIVSQPGGTCNKAHVRATSNLPASQPMSYVGLAAVGSNWRASYGGFANRDASDLWNGIGFTQAVGATLYSDIAIALAYRIQNFTAGSVQQIRFVTILDDLAANNSVNNLFTFTWPGAPPSASTLCNPIVDTVTICNGGSATISVTGSAVADFNWTWSPTLGLSPTTGATVTASPTSSTLYTVTGAPISPCYNPVTQQVFVRVVPGTTNANAGTNRVLTCSTPTAVLNGSSTTAGATYSWAGPGIVSGGATATPTINAVGIYTLTVTAGGCSATDTMSVTQNIIPPNANAGVDQVLTCTTTSLNIAGSSSTVGASCSWAGPGITAGGTTFTPTINAAGNYTVTVTNPANGCTSTDVVAVTLNNTLPNANAGVDQVLTCTTTSLNIAGSSSTVGASCSWAGPGIIAGGTTFTPTINAAGNYTVTVTNPANGCTSTDVVAVTLNNTLPNANAGVDQTLTCVVTSLTLSGSSSTAGAPCVWAGPGITAGGATFTPTINAAGNYTVTVTNPANGCTSTDVVAVTLNNTLPNANAGPDNILNCLVTTLNLNGSSTTPGVNFAWAGPSISAGGAAANPTINGPGLYTVTITDPSNGCTSTDVTNITQNNTPPNANAGSDQVLNCGILSVNLASSSSTVGATCVWDGPGITAGGTTWTPSVNASGNYTITVTDPANGCTSTDVANVLFNGAIPNSNAGLDQILNCTITSLNLSGSSSTAGAVFAWAGPSITAGGATNTPTINGPGNYTVTVTDPSNMCTSTDVVTVTQNITPPNANAGLDQVLNCVVLTVNVSGSSTTPSVSYAWAGPSITSGAATSIASVNGAGTYTVTVTDPVNGCTSTDMAVVTLNNTLPNANAGADNLLNCLVTSLNLSGSSTTVGATYAWSGASIASGGATATPMVNGPGLYTVTVTDPSNGCTSTDVTNITQNITPPNANAGPDDILNCVIPSINLAGSSSTAGAIFSWGGPSIVAGGATANPTVNGAGTYTVTVTDPLNGCTSTDQTIITLNAILPNANAGSDQILNCVVTSLNLSGSSSSAGVSFEWTGIGITAGATTATPTVNMPGTFTLTVTDPTNGCTSTDVVDVVQNITPPGANAGPDDILNCIILSVNLNGSATAGGATFAWSGPSITGGGNTSSPTVNGTGTYVVITTDPANGCTSTDAVDITQNIVAPDISMGSNQIILCNTPVVNLSGNSLTAGVTYSWNGAAMVGTTTNSSVSVNGPGTYTLTVTDPVNGCTSAGTIDAILDLNYPTANFLADNLESCAPLCATLSDNSAVNGSPIASWLWNVESIGTATTSGGTFCFTDPGTYDVTLTVTTVDGCTATLTIPNYLTVHPNPVADFMYTPEEITEDEPLVIFGNASSGGANYDWDFGDGNSSLSENPTHMFGDTGAYCVTLLTTTAFGCSDTITHCLYVAPNYNLFIPNSFTVNDDGLNEVWTVVGLGVKTFEAWVFDRWGEELYYSNDILKGWVGNKQNGSLCMQGVYVYRILVTDYLGDFHEYYGNINLIR